MKKKSKFVLIGVLTLIIILLLFVVFLLGRKSEQGADDNTDTNSGLVEEKVDEVKENPSDKVIDPVIEYDNEMDEYKTESKIDIGEAIINDNEAKNEDGATNDKNGTVKEYTSIELIINMDENPGFGLLDLRCYYNPDVVSIYRIQNGEVHPALDTDPVVQSDSYGTYILLDFDYLGYDFDGTGLLAKISFNVLDSSNIDNAGIEIVMQEIYNSDAEVVEGYSFSTDANIK